MGEKKRGWKRNLSEKRWVKNNMGENFVKSMGQKDWWKKTWVKSKHR